MYEAGPVVGKQSVVTEPRNLCFINKKRQTGCETAWLTWTWSEFNSGIP